MNPAANLILIGPMGAGKTAIGRRLAERLGLAFVDADQALEARVGAPVNLIFEMEGEAGFRRRERAVLAELCAGRDCVIATGGGAVLDMRNRRVLADSGFVLHIHIGVDEQLARLARDRSRPLLAGEDRHARLQTLAEARAPLYDEIADLRFDSNGLSVTTACERLLSLLAIHWQRGREAARDRGHTPRSRCAN